MASWRIPLWLLKAKKHKLFGKINQGRGNKRRKSSCSDHQGEAEYHKEDEEKEEMLEELRGWNQNGGRSESSVGTSSKAGFSEHERLRVFEVLRLTETPTFNKKITFESEPQESRSCPYLLRWRDVVSVGPERQKALWVLQRAAASWVISGPALCKS